MSEIPYGPDRIPWEKTLSLWAKDGDKLLVSPPSRNPIVAYGKQRGITPALYQVPSEGLDDRQREKAQRETAHRTAEQTANFLGYQANMGGNYEVISAFLSSSVNNIGDPFEAGSFTVNSKWMERNVLDYYASLWNAKWPHDPKDPETYWGYVLTMGSSEGNLYGMWNARDYLEGKFMMSDEKTGRYYYTCRPRNPPETLMPTPQSRFTRRTRTTLLSKP